MPIFRSGEAPPPWCELGGFEILDLKEGAVVDQARRGPAERLLVTFGTIQLALPESTLILKENQFLDVANEAWRLRACSAKVQLVNVKVVSPGDRPLWSSMPPPNGPPELLLSKVQLVSVMLQSSESIAPPGALAVLPAKVQLVNDR